MQTDIKKKPNGKKTIMKMQGQLVNMLVNISPEDYHNFVCMEGNHKVLYAKMLKALYGMLQSSPLYYKKFCKDLEEIIFKINSYDLCVVNRMIKGKQHTVTWHLDNLKISYINLKVNSEFLS
jgi:hypothetical protein